MISHLSHSDEKVRIKQEIKMCCPSLEINTFKCVEEQPISYIHSSGNQQTKQQARCLRHFPADEKATGGDDQGKNQL